jgi:hypothetical protein
MHPRERLLNKVRYAISKGEKIPTDLIEQSRALSVDLKATFAREKIGEANGKSKRGEVCNPRGSG